MMCIFTSYSYLCYKVIKSTFLADRTNGRTYATVLRLSVCLYVVCLTVTLCIVAKRCVLEQKLLLRAYRKSGKSAYYSRHPKWSHN